MHPSHDPLTNTFEGNDVNIVLAHTTEGGNATKWLMQHR